MPGDDGAFDAGVGDGSQPDTSVNGPGTATLTVRRSGGGAGGVSAQGAPIACGSECTVTVVVGTEITLVASPEVGAVFGGWAGNGCAGTAATCAVTVTADVEITAQFDVAMFTVNLGLVGSGSGTVMSGIGLVCPGMCTRSVPYNTAVELVAAATGSSTFTGWSGPCAGTGACSFTVTGDTEVMAGFAANNELIVTRAGNGSGSVASAPAGIQCGGDCTQGYPPGTAVTLSATPNADSVFVGWSGEGCTGTSTCQVTMNGAAMVTATFTLRKHVLQVVRSGAGAGLVTSNVPGISCGTDCTESYDAHTVVTLTALSDGRSTFTGWSGGGCSGTGTCAITMEAATTVTATFALRRFVLSVGLTGTGTGSVSSNPAGISCGATCTASFDIDTVVTLSASPGAGSIFAGWSGACSGAGACQVVMTNSNAVTARFEPPGRGLFMINQNAGRLERMDPTTLVGTDVGPLGVPYSVGDCAWNPVDSTLYMVDGQGARGLYRVNLITGAASLVGTHNINGLFALAYHPPSDQLYAIANGTNNLYTISTATGAATLVGSAGGAATQIEGLAWDSRRSRMTALSFASNSFYAINLSTGAATPLQAPGLTTQLGMTYDQGRDRFLVADRVGAFFQFDPSNNFARTMLTTFSSGFTCIALVP
jgi:hypothetical protein